MRRAFIINDVVRVEEVVKPEHVRLMVAGTTALLSKQEFSELCDLKYTVNFTHKEISHD